MGMPERRPTIQDRLGDWALAYRIVLAELAHQKAGAERYMDVRRTAAEVAATLTIGTRAGAGTVRSPEEDGH